MLFTAATTFAQQYTISGTVVDDLQQPLSFVNVVVLSPDAESPIVGTTTNEDGSFTVGPIDPGSYKVTFSFIGYNSLTSDIVLETDISLGEIVLAESTETLDETVVTAKKPTIQKSAGKLVFNVENTSLSQGNTLSLLQKTPGVGVIGEAISIKNRPTTLYLNGKRIYLSPAETSTFLENLDASFIKSVEVVTNPPAQYDAEAGTLLNIITSKAFSPGYKGSVNVTYEQATFPKYQFGTSHFYKNNLVNLYGSYSFSPRKEIKEDDNFVRFFNPNGTTKSIWESDFTRITQSYGHQGNLVVDLNLNDKNTLSATANVFVSPDKTYKNSQRNEIFNAQRQLDSFFLTHSDVAMDQHNLAFNLEHALQIGENGAQLVTAGNYIDYRNTQEQDLRSDYFFAGGSPIRTNSFFTDAQQETTIVIGKMDATVPLGGGTFLTGAKYSDIDTESGLEFFDTENGTSLLDASKSDLFFYEESIYAAYANYDNVWGKLGVNLGLRAEYTDVEGDSQSLGLVNTQEYFELFPTVSLQYQYDDSNSFGIAYKRAINRPRYESLNPFRYFLNESNFNQGNPNLMPSIEEKITLSYNLNNTFFIDGYYQKIDQALELLTFQDNQNQTLRQMDANTVAFQQYSLDLIYASSLTNWWYMSLVTSSYYLESEFFAVESEPVTFTNDTFGFFAQFYSEFTLTPDRTTTLDVSSMYISDFITGSTHFSNQFIFSLSARKSLWNNRASISAGIDDVFNTNNVRVFSKYLNQDNSYFPQIESRLFRVGFTYNFGNFRLRDNRRTIDAIERDRLRK